MRRDWPAEVSVSRCSARMEMNEMMLSASQDDSSEKESERCRSATEPPTFSRFPYSGPDLPDLPACHAFSSRATQEGPVGSLRMG